MPYCLYLRKSRKDEEAEAQGAGETLARHKKALLGLAKQQNLSITKIYSEIVSGDTIAARPVMQELLNDVEQNAWDGVLVMEVERLARGNTIDQGIVAQTFKYSNTKIITPMKTYDPNNEYDEEYFEFGLFMSRREYKTINRRIQRGRIASAQEGKFLGATPPYGYKRIHVENGKGYTLKPDENEADVVKTIYDMYLNGDGMTKISRRLDEMGIKPRFRDTWSKSTINDILTNPVYTGKLRWGYRPYQKYMTNGEICTRRVKSDSPAVYVNGLHPALISDDIFEKAQLIKQQNAHPPTKNGLALQNPLSGLVFCETCGSLMTRLGPNHHCTYDTLRCSNRYCKNISAPVDRIEKQIVESLKNILKQYQLKINYEKPAKEENYIKIKNKAIQNATSEIDIINQQISKTFDLLEQDIYDTDIFTQRNKELAARKSDLQTQIKEISEEIKQEENKKAVRLEQLPRYIKILENYDYSLPAAVRNKTLKEVLNKVVYLKTQRNKRSESDNDNFKIKLYPKLQIR